MRAQRQALQAERRARHEARRRAIDPVGVAQQEAREAEFLRRRQERRDSIEQDRRLFLYGGLGSEGGGLSAWPEQPLAPPIGDPGASGAPPYVPPDWDNGWYFRGW